MQNPKRKGMAALLAGVMLLGTFAVSTPASADSLSDLKKQYSALQQQEEQLQSQLSSQSSALQSAQAQQAALNNEISVTKQQIDLLNTQLASTNAQIAAKQKQIDATEAQITADYHLLKSRLRAMYKSGDDTFLTVLLNSNGINDFLDRMQMVKYVSKHDDSLIAELQADEAQVKKDQQTLNDAKTQLEQFKETMATKQTVLMVQQSQQAQVTAQLKSQVSSTQKQKSSVSSKAAATSAQIAAELAAEQAAAEAEQQAEEAAEKSGNASSVSAASITVPADASAAAASVINYAKNFLKKYPYGYGANGPSSFDCSGLMQYVFKNAPGVKVSLDRTAADQYGDGTPVSSPQPGDLVFFHIPTDDKAGINHVGLYVGNGLMIDAEYYHPGHTEKDIVFDNVFSGYFGQYYVGACRIL